MALFVFDQTAELDELFEKICTGSKNERMYFYFPGKHYLTIDNQVPSITVPYSRSEGSNRSRIARKNQAQVNRRRSLELDFENLVDDIWPLTVVSVFTNTEFVADALLKQLAAYSVLAGTRRLDTSINQVQEPIKNLCNRHQGTGDRRIR